MSSQGMIDASGQLKTLPEPTQNTPASVLT
jgi:hypothetical protein